MNQSAKQKPSAIDASVIEDYLLKHPDFLLDKPELLAKLQLAHIQGHNTVSLIEKQVEVLRKQNKTLDKKLNELIIIARKNEQLSNNLHGFASNLLETRSISDVLALTEDVMRDVFKIDFVAMRMLSDVTDDMLLLIDEETESDLFAEFFTLNKPMCGKLSDEYVRYFFPEHIGRIQSAAMVPLKSVQHLGVLMLGSADAEHFSEDKGLLFLSHIGDLLSNALISHLHN